MFYKYMITKLNDKDVIYLYCTNDYEISNDLYLQYDERDIALQAKNYLDNVGIPYKGHDIFLVVDNVIVGRVELSKILKKPKYYEYAHFGKRYQEGFYDSTNHPVIKFIDFERSTGVIEKVKFYEYLFGVVAREMPYINHPECLKAQAVIARTYLLKTLRDKKRIKEMNKYQLYFDQEYLKKLWEEKYYDYRSNILDALVATDKEVLTFQGDYIECYTHYQNTGKTEDSKNVLKLAYPYLVSVDSMDYKEPDFLRYRKISNSELSQILNLPITPNTKVKILSTTSGNNVQYIQFDNKVFDGLILSRALGLVSNHFTVQIHEDYTSFLTRGCGLGLGLSKCGAKTMAEAGYNYRQILEHYYPNTTLVKVTENTL